jgi:ankyrin repeat protein
MFDNKLFENACKTGNLEMVSEIISETDSDVDVDEDYNHGFDLACEFGHTEIVQLLLSHGVNSEVIGIQMACRKGHLEIVKMMLSYDGDYELHHCLECACADGHIEIINTILEHIKNSEYENKEDYLEFAIECGLNVAEDHGHDQVIKHLKSFSVAPSN